MNVANAEVLLAHLRGLHATGKEYKFDMSRWLGHITDKDLEAVNKEELVDALKDRHIVEPISATDCGTVACIAGHASLIGGASMTDIPWDFAEDWLGLSDEESMYLFWGKWSGKDTNDITLDEAIAHLTSLIVEAKRKGASA